MYRSFTENTESQMGPSFEIKIVKTYCHFFFINLFFSCTGFLMLCKGFFQLCKQGLLFLAVLCLLVVVASSVERHRL